MHPYSPTPAPSSDQDDPAAGPIAPATPTGANALMPEALDDFAQVFQAYNRAAESLQKSHESLRGQVHRLQSELASTNAQLQRSKKLAALGEMAAGIAHEIRNPLTAMQLYADMLAKDLAYIKGGEPLAVTARKIVAAVRGLNSVVNDVLSFAREMKPSQRPVPVGRLFDHAIETCLPQIDEAGVTIVRDSAAEGRLPNPLSVEADAGLVQQALVNLIRNAVQAMASGNRDHNTGDRPARLSISAHRDGTHAVLQVRDTGPGIADRDIDRIFNPFFTTRNTGTGLGLAIVHRIIDAHGGTISVRNDHGAVFELSLPLAKRSIQAGDTESSPEMLEPYGSGARTVALVC